jgi:hypothetical protein
VRNQIRIRVNRVMPVEGESRLSVKVSAWYFSDKLIRES